MSRVQPEARREYHRGYYKRNAKRLCTDARHRYQIRYWTAWLLNELRTNWPSEPAPVYAADLLDSLAEYR